MAAAACCKPTSLAGRVPRQTTPEVSKNNSVRCPPAFELSSRPPRPDSAARVDLVDSAPSGRSRTRLGRGEKTGWLKGRRKGHGIVGAEAEAAGPAVIGPRASRWRRELQRQLEATTASLSPYEERTPCAGWLGAQGFLASCDPDDSTRREVLRIVAWPKEMTKSRLSSSVKVPPNNFRPSSRAVSGLHTRPLAPVSPRLSAARERGFSLAAPRETSDRAHLVAARPSRKRESGARRRKGAHDGAKSCKVASSLLSSRRVPRPLAAGVVGRRSLPGLPVRCANHRANRARGTRPERPAQGLVGGLPANPNPQPGPSLRVRVGLVRSQQRHCSTRRRPPQRGSGRGVWVDVGQVQGRRTPEAPSQSPSSSRE